MKRVEQLKFASGQMAPIVKRRCRHQWRQWSNQRKWTIRKSKRDAIKQLCNFTVTTSHTLISYSFCIH